MKSFLRSALVTFSLSLLLSGCILTKKGDGGGGGGGGGGGTPTRTLGYLNHTRYHTDLIVPEELRLSDLSMQVFVANADKIEPSWALMATPPMGCVTSSAYSDAIKTLSSTFARTVNVGNLKLYGPAGKEYTLQPDPTDFSFMASGMLEAGAWRFETQGVNPAQNYSQRLAVPDFVSDPKQEIRLSSGSEYPLQGMSSTPGEEIRIRRDRDLSVALSRIPSNTTYIRVRISDRSGNKGGSLLCFAQPQSFTIPAAALAQMTATDQAFVQLEFVNISWIKDSGIYKEFLAESNSLHYHGLMRLSDGNGNSQDLHFGDVVIE